jgi:hypothetical protein
MIELLGSSISGDIAQVSYGIVLVPLKDDLNGSIF